MYYNIYFSFCKEKALSQEGHKKDCLTETVLFMNSYKLNCSKFCMIQFVIFLLTSKID